MCAESLDTWQQGESRNFVALRQLPTVLAAGMGLSPPALHAGAAAGVLERHEDPCHAVRTAQKRDCERRAAGGRTGLPR